MISASGPGSFPETDLFLALGPLLCFWSVSKMFQPHIYNFLMFTFFFLKLPGDLNMLPGDKDQRIAFFFSLRVNVSNMKLMMNAFKVDSSMAFSTFTELCNHC